MDVLRIIATCLGNIAKPRFFSYSTLEKDFLQEFTANLSEEEITAALQKILDAYNKSQPTYKQLSRLVVRKYPFFKNASRKIIRHEVLKDEPAE